MKPRYSGRFFRKVLVPVIYGSEHTAALHAALAITGPKNVWAVGILGISEPESLSTAAVPARHVRKTLRELVNRTQIHALQRIRVSHSPWEELVKVVAEED